MVLWYSSSYQRRLFGVVLLIVGLLTLSFFAFQYSRERYYKSSLLDAHLQDINWFVAMDLREGISPEEIFRRHHTDDLRLTLIDLQGEVIFDSELDDASLSENHLERNEVRQALLKGRGHTHRRLSSVNDSEYFYSALLDREVVIRTAMPYDLPLIEILRVDSTYLLYLLPLLPILLLLCYLATRSLSKNIVRLKLLAQRLDQGEKVVEIPPFDNDELGLISNKLLQLYGRLQRAKADVEREYTIARHEEEEKNRIKSQLTNNINHELKTPVSAIRGYLESIHNNPEMDQTMRENFLKRAYEQVERLGDLLADVSTLTRVSEAPQRVIREPLDLIPIIEEVLEEFPIQERQKMEVRLDLPSTLPLEGNIQLLRSIFHNLISNALSYSSGTELHIRLIDQHATGYHFELFDNGQGVEEHHLEHLFERFYRVDKGRSRKLGGTGLGLAIVKHSVLFHGGTIQVENRPEGGLHFRFTLARGGNG